MGRGNFVARPKGLVDAETLQTVKMTWIQTGENSHVKRTPEFPTMMSNPVLFLFFFLVVVVYSLSTQTRSDVAQTVN